MKEVIEIKDLLQNIKDNSLAPTKQNEKIYNWAKDIEKKLKQIEIELAWRERDKAGYGY